MDRYNSHILATLTGGIYLLVEEVWTDTLTGGIYLLVEEVGTDTTHTS